jgi:hypothetical protein
VWREVDQGVGFSGMNEDGEISKVGNLVNDFQSLASLLRLSTRLL